MGRLCLVRIGSYEREGVIGDDRGLMPPERQEAALTVVYTPVRLHDSGRMGVRMT